MVHDLVTWPDWLQIISVGLLMGMGVSPLVLLYNLILARFTHEQGGWTNSCGCVLVVVGLAAMSGVVAAISNWPPRVGYLLGAGLLGLGVMVGLGKLPHDDTDVYDTE
jgi:peptidoglycan biosynthesis protein MviN/MurJ (putative lipid II flippase)